MAAVQHIEAAVGEDQRTRQRGYARGKLARLSQLALEGGGGAHLIEVFEQPDHMLHAAGGAGNFGGRIGFGALADTQRSVATYRDRLDGTGVDALVVDEAQLYVRGNQAFAGARSQRAGSGNGGL